MRRTPGTGSYFQRGGDGLWCASFTIGTAPRRKLVITAKTRERLDAKVADAIADGRISIPPAQPTRTRREWLAEARSRGTHSAAEWYALVRAHPKVCRYCGVRLNVFNGTKDHIIPITHGGSDAIDNLDYVCWECNQAKRGHDRWVYKGPHPRPFRPHPKREADWKAVRRHVA